MAKKIEEIEEKEIDESTEELEEEIVEKKAKVKKKLESAGTTSKEAQNIIGEIKPPEAPENKEDVLSYFKKLDEKIDRLLKSKETENPLEDEDENDDENDQPEKKAKRRHSNGKGVKGERRDHFGFKY